METSPLRISRCVFCRMPTPERFLRLPMCAICRDQFYDFLWASGVNAGVGLPAGLSGRWFVVEEALMFVVLVFVKHRFPLGGSRPA
jgi:hypothetical protein